jgi:ubiquinone/menaquinone biosynthesis C-methylase UbiE
VLSHAIVGVPGRRVGGDVLVLPFSANRYDAVVSAWVIETVADPVRAVSEHLRVLSTTGYLLYSFCSLPEGWLSRAGSLLLRKVVEKGFAGSSSQRKRFIGTTANVPGSGASRVA